MIDTDDHDQILADPNATTDKLRSIIAELQHVNDWLEKGNAEWRDRALAVGRQAEAARASARVAVTMLQTVVTSNRTRIDQQTSFALARDWLRSIGSEPT